MESCWIVTTNNKNILQWRDIPMPQPGRDEIVMRVQATALNRGELLIGGATHGGPEKLGGIEAAGEISHIGSGVKDFKIGDRVFGRVRGGFAQYCSAPAHQMIPLPKNLNFIQAAAIPISYLTAYEMLYPPYGKLKKGEWLLVTGASAGAGAACIQLAKILGAKSIGTSGSTEKLEKLSTIGLDIGIQTRSPDFAAKVKDATGGRGVDLAVNLVGGTLFAECLHCLARKGRVAVVGYVDGSLIAEIDLGAVHSGRFEIFGISNSQLSGEERRKAVVGFKRDVMPAIIDGRITPLVDSVFQFTELQDAKEWMEGNEMAGKIVVDMG